MDAQLRPSSFRRTSSSASSIDSPSSSAATAAVTQTLSSVLNNPSASASASWAFWWPAGPTSAAAAADFSSFSPLPSAAPGVPDVSRHDFASYLTSISESFSRFEDVRSHAAKEALLSDADASAGPGEALVACLREVPSLFFKEDFALEEGETFRAACPFSPDPEENAELQERLGQYLDVVEMHLVREIALRSASFFEAQGRLQGVDSEIVTACSRIRQLRETVKVLTTDIVGSAKQIQELNDTRGNLVALQQKLAVILYVSQAVSALKLVAFHLIY